MKTTENTLHLHTISKWSNHFTYIMWLLSLEHGCKVGLYYHSHTTDGGGESRGWENTISLSSWHRWDTNHKVPDLELSLLAIMRPQLPTITLLQFFKNQVIQTQKTHNCTVNYVFCLPLSLMKPVLSKCLHMCRFKTKPVASQPCQTL